MKYKAINIATGKETLCDKVTIDGFDYYVSYEKPLDKEPYYVDNSLGKRIETAETKPSGIVKRVITCNNPNIDIPKVVDEVEQLAMDKLKNKWSHLYQFGYPKKPFPTNYENDLNCVLVGLYKSQETHFFSEDDVVEFVVWLNDTDRIIEQTKRIDFSKSDIEVAKELLQIWKEQQPKTVYYQHKNP